MVLLGTDIPLFFLDESSDANLDHFVKINIFLCCYTVFKKIFIYLFILFLALSGLSCSMWDLSLQCMGLSLVVARELQSAWAQ